jgi:hypothetical protein
MVTGVGRIRWFKGAHTRCDTLSPRPGRRLGCIERKASAARHRRLCGRVQPSDVLRSYADRVVLGASCSSLARSGSSPGATVTKSESPNDRVICRYCALESAVSHASQGECIDALRREIHRLRDRVPPGRLGSIAVLQPASEPIAQRATELDGARVSSPSGDHRHPAAMVSLSLSGPNR